MNKKRRWNHHRLKRNAAFEDAKLNITSMMDMFTIILVFLLKNFSTQGQIITPSTGLMLPTSTVQQSASEGLVVKLSQNDCAVENTIVLNKKDLDSVQYQKEFMINKLYTVLTEYAKHGQNSSNVYGTEFSGQITIQADIQIPYKLLTRILYTCGQSGYPNMNLLVYRKE